VIAGLEPTTFWSHFDALTRIARPSRHEEPAIEHVHRWAGEHETDDGAAISVTHAPTASRDVASSVRAAAAWTEETTATLLDAIALVPTGPPSTTPSSCYYRSRGS
jgi:hypothetical protein